ncbi:MAG: pyridoxamine 5'-phosphate oxidase family protein, partial [Nocardioidaceae bacterium]
MHEPVELTVEECVGLLRSGVIGRVALSTPMGPRIVPVNYAVYEDTVVFRTTPYSELGTYGWNTDLAFEIDHLDYEKHQGWSVVAIGRAELVEDP